MDCEIFKHIEGLTVEKLNFDKFVKNFTNTDAGANLRDAVSRHGRHEDSVQATAGRVNGQRDHNTGQRAPPPAGRWQPSGPSTARHVTSLRYSILARKSPTDTNIPLLPNVQLSKRQTVCFDNRTLR